MAAPVRVQGGMPQVTVSQSTMVALALFVLFLVYITAKGELQNYLAVLFGTVSTTASGTGSTGTPSGTGATSSVQGALGMAQQATSTLQQTVGLANQASNLLSGGGGGQAGSSGNPADYIGNIDVGGGGDITGSLSSTGGLF